MEWLPYFVGSKVQLEVIIKSSRERGISWMDLTYFDFIEKMPGEPPRFIGVDENNIRIHKKNKRKGTIYPMNVRHIPRAGEVEYSLSDKVTQEKVSLFSEDVAFPFSSKNTYKIIAAILTALLGLICSVIGGVTIYKLTH
jgi:hypothetical protein